MKMRLAIAGLALAPVLSGCTTDDLDLFDTALYLYSDVSYLNGDCPFGQNIYYDREGHHGCTYADVPERHHGGGHHHGGGQGDYGDDTGNDSADE